MQQNQSFLGMPTDIRVLKFLITETGTYNPMFRRAYATNMDASTLGAIQEKVVNSNHITPQMLGGLADRFILPTMAPEEDQFGKDRQILIPHGWGERRLRFLLEVETSFGMGGAITELVQGYTDHLGVTFNGVIDPQMQFHINSVLKVRKQVENTPFGAKSYFNVVDSAHVLVDNLAPNMYATDTTERMRPEDLFSAMSRRTYANIGTFVDERTTQGGVPVLSNRKNGIPTNYLSEVMEGYQNALIDPTDSAGNPAEHFSKARAYAASPSIQMDAFIKAISNIRRQPISSCFSFADLVALDPNTQRATKYAKTGAPQVTVASNFGGLGHSNPWDQPHQAGASGTKPWDYRDLSTHAAVVLGNAVPALLMELALTGIHFKSTNRNLGTALEQGNKMTTTVGNWESFSDFDMTNHLRTFVTRLEREIMYGLTDMNRMDYMLEMRVDLLGDTWIQISMCGEPPAMFAQPSFADALAVPILTNNRQSVSTVVDDIGAFLHAVIPMGTSYGDGGESSSNFIL